MEEPNDADGPNPVRRTNKKRILRIDDSDEDSVKDYDEDNLQLTGKRKSNRPVMEKTTIESSCDGTDDSNDSSDDVETENSGESSDTSCNASNTGNSSDWTTDSEDDDNEDEDITRPSTSRACTQRINSAISSRHLSDKIIMTFADSSQHSPMRCDELLDNPTSPPDEGPLSGRNAVPKRCGSESADGKSTLKDRDNFQGSSSETDDAEGPKSRCPICLRSLPGPGGSEVGSPEGCQHSFCVCCIQEWAKNVNTCPVDRHEFSEIVVLEGVGGREIRRLPLPKKPIMLRAMEDDDITVISQIEEDPIYCEVCGSGDREDSLLLCDGCNQGYHLECLIPPLASVPIEEWFCPQCTGAEATRQRATRVSRNMQRLLPRTSASQRVLRSLRRDAVVVRGRRGLRTWNIDSRDLELMEEMAELEAERRWAENNNSVRPSTSRGLSSSSYQRRQLVRRRRKKRRRVVKKTVMKDHLVTDEEEVMATSSRRGRKRRSRGGKKSRRTKKHQTKKTARSSLADTLGIVPGRKGLILRKKGVCGRGGGGGSASGYNGSGEGGVVLNGMTSGSRVPTLSIFGSRNDLDYFSDGSDAEGGGGSVAVASVPRPVDSVHARQMAKERLVSSIGSAAERRKALIKERALASASPSSNVTSGVPDLLGSIMESQAVWHGRKSRVKINPDGSLAVEKSKKMDQSQVAGSGDRLTQVGPKSVEATKLNNEMNVNSGTARVPSSNPAEPSTAAQESCSTFRDGSTGMEIHNTVSSVETCEAIDVGVRPLWPVRTPGTDSRDSSVCTNHKERIPSENVNEMVCTNRVAPSTAAHGTVSTCLRATNNFRSIEHLAGNVIVNSNRSFLDLASDDDCVMQDSNPASSVKNDNCVITSDFSNRVNPTHTRNVLSGAASFGIYGSPNSPLDLSSSSHKGDDHELLHRNMYLDLSSGGGGGGGACYGASYNSGICEAVDMRLQSLPGVTAVAEDLRVASNPLHGASILIRSLSVIKENPSVESSSRSISEPITQDIHSNISELPSLPSEGVASAVATPLKAVKTVGLPGSSGNGSPNQTVNSSVSSGRTSTGSGGSRGTTQRVDYARTNSNYRQGPGDRDANGSGDGGGDDGDRNNHPQLLKRRVDEDEEDEKDDREEEDEDVDIYSDIEPGGSDPPTDNVVERHGLPVHAIELPSDPGTLFLPSLQPSGSEKYDPAEPSYDTDDEMVIDEEGDNEEESHRPKSAASLEGEVPPPPPLPPSLLDSIAKSPEDLELSSGYDRERSVTPTEEDERRKSTGEELEGGMGRPPVGVRVYGILSQGKFGLGIAAYGSDDEEDDNEGCPNFSIYSAASMDIARTAETSGGDDSKREASEQAVVAEKCDESLKVSHEGYQSSPEAMNAEYSNESESDSTRLSKSTRCPQDPIKEREGEKVDEEPLLGNETGYEQDLEKSDVEAERSEGKSDAETEKSDAETEKSDSEAQKSDIESEADKYDVELERCSDGGKGTDSKSMEESPSKKAADHLGDKETGQKSGEKWTECMKGQGNSEDNERSTVVVPELEGLETETISEAEEATAFEDLEASRRRTCGGEEEEGEIVDVREKSPAKLMDKTVDKEAEKELPTNDGTKKDESAKRGGKKEGRRRKKVEGGGETMSSDAGIAWKKLSKTGKERNYREKGVEDSGQSKKDLEDKENRRGKKERDKRKGKRKDLERYDVRKVVGERSKTKRRRTDAFGRELRSNSKSRSRSRLFSRSRSRGVRSRSRGGGGRSRSQGRSRSRGARSRSHGVRSRSRGRRSRSRGGRSRSRGNSRTRLPSKTRGRSRSRGKGRGGRSRSRSRVRQRSRSRGGRSRSHAGRSRSRQKSRDRASRRGENVYSKAPVRKRRRSRSPVSDRRKQSRSRSHQRKRSVSRNRRRKGEQLPGSWERSWSRSWSRSATPIQSRSLEKAHGNLRSRSASGSEVVDDRSPMPLSRSPSQSRGRSFCRSPSTPTLPPPPRGRMGLQSMSRSPSRTPERLRSPAIAVAVTAAGNKKKKRKKEGRRKETESAFGGGKKKKKRRERSPAASKEVFASGDNILVSVSFKSAPKENTGVLKRRKASSPVEEKVKVVEGTVVDPGTKRKRKFMPVVKKKPSVIIDLETSPFVERVPSPADLIVLSDSSGENEEKAAKQQPLDSDGQRRHRMMLISPAAIRKSGSSGVKEKRVGGKLTKKGKVGGKGKKGVGGKKDRKASAAMLTAGIAPSESTSIEEPPLPLSVPEEMPIERRLGPKTPPEPQVKFCIASKGSQLRSVNNPLREDDDEEEDDEIGVSDAIAAVQMDINQKNIQSEVETVSQDNVVDGNAEPETRQTTQVGPNTPPGPSTPEPEEIFNEVGSSGRASPGGAVTQEELASSRSVEEGEAENKESSVTFEEQPSRKEQEMDTYDPFEPTNSPAPSPPALSEAEQGPLNDTEDLRDAPASNVVEGLSQAAEEGPPEEEVATAAEPRSEEPTEPTTEEADPPATTQGSVEGVANIARTLGTTVGAIDAMGGLVLPLLAQLGAVAQPLNAAVAAVTSANSPVVQQQQLPPPLVSRTFSQQPQQAKAADVIRTLFGSGLRQFPEMVMSSGASGAFSVSQPKVSKTDLSLGGGVRAKGGPRVAVTAPRVAVATPRVVAPTPRVAVTPRVATANGKDQAPPPGSDRVDVVDMDLESPYSPASSEGDDLFEPPSYESAARQTSMMSQPVQQSKCGMKGSQRTGGSSSQEKFDNLFGGSPMRRNSNSGAGKMQGRGAKNHKGSKAGKQQRGKSGGKVNIRSEEDHHLTILDELPNSAVEMQVKEKFLIKLNRQERVVEEVKLALKPHYNKKHLTKEEYKDILRRSVPKICHNRSGEINPIKIRSLVEAYVRKFRYARKKGDCVPAVRGGKGKKAA